MRTSQTLSKLKVLHIKNCLTTALTHGLHQQTLSSILLFLMAKENLIQTKALEDNHYKFKGEAHLC